jgi:hypothetical protein
MEVSKINPCENIFGADKMLIFRKSERSFQQELVAAT